MVVPAKIQSLSTGLTGLGVMEAFDKANIFLATKVIESTGVSPETVTQVAESVMQMPTHPLAILDALGKLAISILTVWKLIKKPKPKDA